VTLDIDFKIMGN